MAERDDKGKFVKGHAKKGGRKEGTTNVVQKELRLLLQDFTLENFNTFATMALQCDPKDFCKLYVDVAKLVLPSLQSISLDSSEEIKQSIESKLLLLSQKENGN